MSFINIKLSETQKYKKFQLASAVGYNVVQVDNMYIIQGADSWIDNCFKSIDEILLLIRADLMRKGFFVSK